MDNIITMQNMEFKLDTGIFSKAGNFLLASYASTWNEFINEINSVMSEETLTPEVHTYTDVINYSQNSEHVDTSSHTDGSGYSQIGSHYNTYSGYSQKSPDIGGYSETVYYSKTHADGERYLNDTTWKYTDIVNGNETMWKQDYKVGATHGDYAAHNDKYQEGPHSDSVSHSDGNYHYDSPSYSYYTYSDSTIHTDAPVHADTGFDHQNYKPTKPEVFNLSADKSVQGTVVVGLYSYDKNRFGFGSQGVESQDVYYHVSIRKLRKLDGTADYTTYTILANGVKCDSNGGYQFNFNTIDPLLKGNTDPKATEGFYEFLVYTRNKPNASWGLAANAFQSDMQVMTIKIQQNQSPTIESKNANDFINFYFNTYGAGSTSGTFTEYDNMYKSLTYSDYTGQKQGILVKVAIKDPDSAASSVKNYQTAEVLLRGSDNIQIGSPVKVVWNQPVVPTDVYTTSSEANAEKIGYALIPVSAYQGYVVEGKFNAKIVLRVQDWRAYNSTTKVVSDPAGPAVETEKVSEIDARTMLVNIGNKLPNQPVINPRGDINAVVENVELTWNPTLDAWGGPVAYYIVNFGRVNADSSITWSYSGTANTHFTVPNVRKDAVGSNSTTYIWSISSVDKFGASIESVRSQFRVYNTPPEAPTDLWIDDSPNVEGVSLNPRFSAIYRDPTDPNPAVAAEVRVNTAEGTLVKLKEFPLTSLAPGDRSGNFNLGLNLSVNTEYTWEIRFKDSKGDWGTWSTAQTFKTLKFMVKGLNVLKYTYPGPSDPNTGSEPYRVLSGSNITFSVSTEGDADSVYYELLKHGSVLISGTMDIGSSANEWLKTVTIPEDQLELYDWISIRVEGIKLAAGGQVKSEAIFEDCLVIGGIKNHPTLPDDDIDPRLVTGNINELLKFKESR